MNIIVRERSTLGALFSPIMFLLRVVTFNNKNRTLVMPASLNKMAKNKK
jgi:hypothetical protein